MALLLETTIGDLVIDLDVDGSPTLCKNVLKLAKARYYTSNLVYNVQPNRFCQLGDPCGDGTGGACIYGVLDAYEKVRKNNDINNINNNNNSNSNAKPDVLASQRRFLKSDMGRALTEEECRQRGRVVATEINGIPDTIGSQLLITVDEGPERSLDNFRNITTTGNKESMEAEAAFVGTEGLTPQTFRSVGMVVEDDNDVLGKINSAYCDANGRPYADIRVIRALVIEDPYEDPAGMDQLLEDRGVVVTPVENPQISAHESDDESLAALRHRVSTSPDYERPPEETVEIRISASEIVLDDANAEQDQKKMRMLKEQRLQREDKSRAVVLEMLGDLPSADVKAPENVLFVCKLNSVTEDEDLELIFSRFDEKVSVEIVRDHKTGASLQYAFVEFTTKEKAAEAYFKMNNALVDDRRIKVDFSQSVAKVWDRFNQRHRKGLSSNAAMPRDPFHEQQQGPRSRHENKGRNNDNRDNHRFSNNRQGSSHSRIHDRKQNSRDGRYNDRSRRERNSDRDRNHRDRDRSNPDNRRHDRHPRQSVKDQTHFDRDHHDHRSRRHDEGRDRDRTRESDRSRNRNDDYRRHESSSHRKDKKRRHDSDTDEYAESDRHGRSHSRNHRRQRKDKGDRRRRSRSRSRSSSRSGEDRREQRRSSGKTSRRKRGRKSDEDKRYRRDRHHHHTHPSGSNRRRQSPSSSRS